MAEPTPIKKRVAPSVPLSLELVDDNGAKFTRNFRLTLDFNALARIEEKTGLKMLGLALWTQLSARVVGAALWAAVLAHHPEYDTIDGQGKPTDEGLEAIRSYIDVGNEEKITEALWETYMVSLPKEKADALRQLRAKHEAQRNQSPNGETPAPTPAGS